MSLVQLGAPQREMTVGGVVTTRRGKFRTQADQIRYLRQMVKEYRGSATVRALARDIVFRQYNVEPRNEVGYALAIGSWVQANVTYVRELPEEFQTPTATIQMGYGDCDDFAVLTCALLEALGIESELVALEWDTPNGRGFGHIFARANVRGMRVSLDATLELPIETMTDPVRMAQQMRLPGLRVMVA